MNPILENDAAPNTGGVLTIEGKRFGRGSKALFPHFDLPIPAEWQSGATVTVRDLIERVVRTEVAAFRERQEKRTVLQTLTAAQIADGAVKGKIDSGGTPDAVQEVDADAAVANALQAFQDGAYFVLIDDDQKSDLEDTFAVATGTRVTFLRLVALAGG